jgi:hypothetical protein
MIFRYKHIKTIVVFSMAIVFLFACSNDIAVVNQIFKNETGPDEISKDIHLYVTFLHSFLIFNIIILIFFFDTNAHVMLN